MAYRCWRAAELALVLAAASCVVVIEDGLPEPVQRRDDYASFEGREFVFLPLRDGGREPEYRNWLTSTESGRSRVPASRAGQRGRLAMNGFRANAGHLFPACLEDGTLIYYKATFSIIGRPRYIYFPDEVREAESMVGRTVWLDRREWPRVPEGFHLAAAEVVAALSPADLPPKRREESRNRPLLRCRASDGRTVEVQLRRPPMCLESDPFTGKDWPDTTTADIRAQKVHVGMTPEQATLSWGKPSQINASDGVEGASEQWLYHDARLLLFCEGRLTKWQTRRAP